MSGSAFIYVTRWLIRDTFRQALASHIFWIMLAVSGLCTLFCLGVSIRGGEPLKAKGDTELYKPGTNEPLTVTVSASASKIPVGTPVNFVVHASDPDGPIWSPSCLRTYHDFGDGTGRDPCTVPSCPSPAQYGPWTTPPTQPDSLTESFVHSWDKPGTYTVTFAYGGPDGCRGHEDPYVSSGTATATVTVT